MTWHVVGHAGPRDPFLLDLNPPDQMVEVPFDDPGHPHSLKSTISKLLADYGLRPSVAAEDFLWAAIAAYVADVRIPRDTAFDGWTRDIVLYVPMREPERWTEMHATFEQLLSFLTGDRWQMVVRPAPPGYRPYRLTPRRSRRRPRRIHRLSADVVSLFSGGLDSYIGAIDQLERNDRVVLVGHHGAGNGPTSVAQTDSLAALRKYYDEAAAPFLHVWLTSPIGVTGASEITTRARSILFMALGAFFADSLNAQQLVVPENGWISLNVPLTLSRIGSFSTRTTHPYLMELLRQVLAQLGLTIEIVLPYRFQTKGEMVSACVNQEILMTGLPSTMSCAHPAAGRFAGGRNPNQHCGRCLPCLVRRAAITASRSDPTSYTWENAAMPLTTTTAADLKAVKIALDRYADRPPRLADVLQSGPLPDSDTELHAYLDVFRRGLDELRVFLASVGALEH